MKTIVVIGATGQFGGRICRRFVGEHNALLVVTSRSAESAKILAATLRTLSTNAEVRAAALDQFAATFENDLAALNPDIVLHTAGPYQGQAYRVALACIRCGSHYIDLADGRDFVLNFDQLHQDACRRDVLLVAGASTLPGLSSAVIDYLRGQFEKIREIEISIAPAHQTPRGRGTIAAVLSYCGRPFDVLIDEKVVTRYGWQDLKLQRYDVLGTRLSAVCDVPDLDLLPAYAGGAATVTFHAALEAKWEHLTLWAMAWLTRIRVVRNWSRFIRLFQFVSDRLISFGSDTGGMRIRVHGKGSNGLPRSVTWTLIARQNHGPEIPCVAALILARRLVRDTLSTRGAFACLGMITLAEFDEEVRDLDIEWRVEESIA